jgi:CRP-like cAMP-binding protein
VESLRSVPLFEGATDDELRRVAGVTTEIRIPAGSIVFSEGELGMEAFVLLEGEAEVVRHGQHVATIGPGEVVGELALLDHSARSATVRAVTDVRAVSMSSREFHAVLESVPTFLLRVCGLLARRLRALDDAVYG